MIRRFSSRRQPLDRAFLTERLQDARAYDGIAGYFSSSILEAAGDALESVSGTIRMVCNSDLDVRDVATAKAAEMAIRREWCASQPERLPATLQGRFVRLYDLLRSSKLQVKVLPRERFGLAHGKAGLITLANGSQTTFIGSVNATYSAWKSNYELLWEDDSPDAAQWVAEEFSALWFHPDAVKLADFVIEDIGRLARRRVITRADWREHETPDAAPVFVEAPVYRQEYGLWEHQKYFVKLAFDAHRGPHGARFVLADMVGLGKTLQLAMAAELMALYGEKPVLIIVPKALLWQWQDELWNLLDLPSAVWNGVQWIDEHGLEYPKRGHPGIKTCPRRVGIISNGLIKRQSEAVVYLKQLEYECIIVDEAHAARRRNLGPNREQETPDANNLLAFLFELAPRTKSLLLATATPVQLYPVEAWDLLNVLNQGAEAVLGTPLSCWRRFVGDGLELAMGQRFMPDDVLKQWHWIRNPLPPSAEGRDFQLLRRALQIDEAVTVVPGNAWDNLSQPDKARIRKFAPDFGSHHNPFIRHIVRRSRDYLETTLNPETGEPYLTKIEVKLFGEDPTEAIHLPPYLQDAYHTAEAFCKLFAQRKSGTGFLKTLLLRRVGSTMYAGRLTAERLLESHSPADLAELERHPEVEDPTEDQDEQEQADMPDQAQRDVFTAEERAKLREFIAQLDLHKDRDPKYASLRTYLLDKHWLTEGCIIFSQYYDSIWWVAEELSKELPEEPIGMYAGSSKSRLIFAGQFTPCDRETLKNMVYRGELRLLLATDAASEGLNLQRLGTLINLDLPWNPTRLEQRKGRIQRIGQTREVVKIYNMRYQGSVEDQVHDILSARFQHIHQLFGQIPDVLEDVWIDVALGEIEKAKCTIDGIPPQHPFEMKYNQIAKVSWEACAQVLDLADRKRHLMRGW